MPVFDPASFYRTFRHGMADVNGVRLHYVIGGAGPPVVLLHGWPLTWYSWRHVMPLLAEQYTVLAPDLRGLGNSGKPTSGYDKKTVAEDVYQLVQQLGFGPVLLVGHDIGGLVAYPYAAAHRESVRKLVIIETTLMGAGPEVGLEAKLDSSAELRLWHMTFHMVPGLAEMLVAGRERQYLAQFYDRNVFQPDAISGADLDVYVRSYAAPGGLGMGHYRTFYLDFAHSHRSELVAAVRHCA